MLGAPALKKLLGVVIFPSDTCVDTHRFTSSHSTRKWHGCDVVPTRTNALLVNTPVRDLKERSQSVVVGMGPLTISYITDGARSSQLVCLQYCKSGDAAGGRDQRCLYRKFRWS